MQAAKKTQPKNNSQNNINIDNESVTQNNINFDNISAANQASSEQMNMFIENIGKFGTDCFNFATKFVSRGIKSGQTLTDITSEFMDEIYKTNANNIKESLTCSSFIQIADLTENTINTHVNYLTRYSNDLLSLYSLNFDKIINEV